MSELVLTPLAPRWSGSTLRQACRVGRPGSARGRDSELWWESDASLTPLETGDGESALVACVLPAMAEGRDLRVEGFVGPRLLANLEEFVTAWNRWKPGIYRKIRIQADEIRPPAPAAWSPDAIAAFSGGVDATYTVWRHHAGLAGNASRRLVACAMVHGFDIPLEHEEKFAEGLRLARETLESVGIDLVPLRTNLRQEFPLDWHDHHGAALVAALQLLKSRAATLLVGASDPYDQLLLPYGSNPVTDPLLSSDGLAVVHDGCGADRTAKIATIAAWKTACRNLRVCWKGMQVGANCGRCEKCLRTRLNFLVNRLTPPEGLAPAGTDLDFRVLDSESRSVLQEHEQILDAARAAGLRDPWVGQLEARLAWLGRRNAALRGARSVKRLMRRIARRIP